MVDSQSVFEAVQRGYSELSHASNAEIIDYFSNVSPDEMTGHISNIKGIVFEQEVAEALNEQGLDAVLFSATNHPVSDIALMNDGDIAAEIQLKATDSVDYTSTTLAMNDDVPIVTTSEVAEQVGTSDLIFDSGIENEDLTAVVTDTLNEDTTTEYAATSIQSSVDDSLGEALGDSLLPIPISPIGIIAGLLGLPFL